jgi:hypothetical protein
MLTFPEWFEYLYNNRIDYIGLSIYNGHLFLMII